MRLRWVVLMILVTGSAMACGCATSQDDNKVSTIPWNRPQSWEGSSGLGGMRTPGASGY
jgi:hypothetical protein